MNLAIKYYILILILAGALKYPIAQQTTIDSLKNELNTLIADSSKINALCTLSHLYKDKNFDSTFFYAVTALKISETVTDSSIMMNACNRIMKTAIYYRSHKMHDQAEELMILCLNYRKRYGTEFSLMASYNNLMVIYISCKKYDDAISMGKKAREIALKYIYSPDSIVKLNALNGLGNNFYYFGEIHYERGEYELAIKNFLESVQYRNVAGNPRTKAQSLSGLANIYLKQKNYTQAINYFNAAYKLYKENKKITGMIKTTRNLGYVYELQHDYKTALSYYNETLAMQVKYPPEFEFHKTYLMLGNLYYHISCLPDNEKQKVINSLNLQHDLQASKLLTDTAETYFTKAYHLSKQTGDKLTLIKSLKGLADISSKNQAYGKAISQLNEIITMAKELHTKVELYEAYQSLSIALEKSGRISESFNYYKLYSVIKDSIFNENSSRRIAEIQVKFETEKKDQEIELLIKDKKINEEQLARQKVQQNGIVIIMIFLVIVGFLIFRSQHLRKKLEKQTAIIHERKRISADLHDDVGSGLSSIMLLSELVKKVAKTPETRKEAEKISTISQELSSNISEIIWALNSNNDYVDNLVAYIRRYAAEYVENSPVKLKIITPGYISRTPISGEHRRNIFFTVKEAMHNIIKHADATEVELNFSVQNNVLFVVIHDNGKGMPNGELNRFGNGLNNMRKRMTSINGKFIIENHMGTKITLSLPI